jgi:EAL and modified HD-GYP domain-containing signal transduction protein
MFGFLKRWFDGVEDKPKPKPEAEPEGSPAMAVVTPPRAAPAGADDGTRSFVHREAILDRKERIAGDEFVLNRKLEARLSVRNPAVQCSYDDALLRSIISGGIERLAEQRLAFVRLSPLSLDNPLIEQLPAGHAVFLLDLRSEFPLDLVAVAARLAALRTQGVRHGWLLRQDLPALQPLLAQSDFIQVEASAFDGLELRALATRLRTQRAPDAPPVQLIARELQSNDEFSLCFHSGFDLFQGAFVSSHENWAVRKSDINRIRIIELLNQVRSGAELTLIAEGLKTEPILSFKLLRYVNSAAMGLLREVTSISQGLVTLGRDKTFRWLSLLLFDTLNPSYRERVLTERALARGRFMEGLAGHGRVPAVAEQLFMTGLFSLLDRLMGQKMPEMLRQITLPEPVTQALLGQSGGLGDILQLAIAMESGDPEAIAQAADRCGVSDEEISHTALEALSWALKTVSAAEL